MYENDQTHIRCTAVIENPLMREISDIKRSQLLSAVVIEIKCCPPLNTIPNIIFEQRCDPSPVCGLEPSYTIEVAASKQVFS